MTSVDCPVCQSQVTSMEKIRINGVDFTLFLCPQCLEEAGSGKRLRKRKLAFVQDEEGKVMRLSQLTAGAAAGKQA